MNKISLWNIKTQYPLLRNWMIRSLKRLKKKISLRKTQFYLFPNSGKDVKKTYVETNYALRTLYVSNSLKITNNL